MTKNEAIHLLETIRAIYPKYEISKKKAQILTPQLQPMDHKLVMDKLSAYVVSRSYPPTIAEIAVYPAAHNVHLDKIKRSGGRFYCD